jgi:hypothetical protein
MSISNKAITVLSTVGIVAVLVLASFVYTTYKTSSEVIDPPATFYFSLNGEITAIESGEPVEGIGVGGLGSMSFNLASSGEYLCFLYDNIMLYDKATDVVSKTILANTSMELGMSTLAVSGADDLGKKTVATSLGDKVCHVYRTVYEDTGDVFTVYVSSDDMAVYATDFSVKRFIYDGSGVGTAVTITGTGVLVMYDKTMTSAYEDDPSVGTTVEYALAGTGTNTTSEGTTEHAFTGSVVQKVVCVGTPERYGAETVHYLIGLKAASDDGMLAIDTSYLLSMVGGKPLGGTVEQTHVMVDGRMCTIWSANYQNLDKLNYDDRIAYDWMGYINVAIAEDGTGDIVKYAFAERNAVYGVDDQGKYTLKYDAQCKLDVV